MTMPAQIMRIKELAAELATAVRKVPGATFVTISVTESHELVGLQFDTLAHLEETVGDAVSISTANSDFRCYSREGVLISAITRNL